MITTVNKLREELGKDIGIFHHVDGCYTVIAPVPEGAEIGGQYWQEDGSLLLLRGIAHLGGEETTYELNFESVSVVLTEQPVPAPKSTRKSRKEAEAEAAKLIDDSVEGTEDDGTDADFV
jgi:hypothetical protein